MKPSIPRRHLLVGVAGTALLATSTQAQSATPQSIPDRNESYLWAATTWFTLGKSSLDRFQNASEDMGVQWSLNMYTPVLFEEMGVWKALLVDAESVAPPSEYQDFHDFLLRQFESLDRASRYFTDGIILSDMELVERGIDLLQQGYLDNNEYRESGFGGLLVNRSGQELFNLEGIGITQSKIVQAKGSIQNSEEILSLDLATGPTVGDQNASVTMHIFSDFQCHFCKSFYDESLPLIIEDFVRPGEIQLVFHDFPRLGTDTNIADPNDLTIEISDPNNESAQAAHAAMCAGEQEAYMTMADYLFKNYRGVQVGGFARSNLNRFALDMGLDVDAFSAAMDSGRYFPSLAKSVEQGQSNRITATPMFILDNGNGDVNVIQQTAEGYTLLKRQIEVAVQTATR